MILKFQYLWRGPKCSEHSQSSLPNHLYFTETSHEDRLSSDYKTHVGHDGDPSFLHKSFVIHAFHSISNTHVEI